MSSLLAALYLLLSAVWQTNTLLQVLLPKSHYPVALKTHGLSLISHKVSQENSTSNFCPQLLSARPRPGPTGWVQRWPKFISTSLYLCLATGTIPLDKRILGAAWGPARHSIPHFSSTVTLAVSSLNSRSSVCTSPLSLRVRGEATATLTESVQTRIKSAMLLLFVCSGTRSGCTAWGIFYYPITFLDRTLQFYEHNVTVLCYSIFKVNVSDI